MGNLSDALGNGWSVEDAFAWAIGEESELTLPLPGGDLPYTLRFDVHPALFPPTVPRQRLTIRAGDTELGSFEMQQRETIAVDLPPELTRDVTTLHLTLVHPDADRPIRPSPDQRFPDVGDLLSFREFRTARCQPGIRGRRPPSTGGSNPLTA